MNKHFYLSFLLIICLMLCINSHAANLSPKRIALVIGNSAYRSFPVLVNPINDSADMAKKLEEFGFDVKLLENANRRNIEEAITQFGKKLNRKDAVGLFYFAGHGVQVDGINYLIPIGANIKTVADVQYEAVNAERVLSNMESADNNLNLMILDACRDNPLPASKRSATRGLARMSAPTGSMVLYATSPGKSALDGEPDDRNGLFTGKLLQVMNQPGLTVYEVFRQTAQAVNSASNSFQTPYLEGVILGDFKFFEELPNATLTIKTSPDDAHVRILNIKSKYKHGMALDPGRYHIEVTHPGYQRYLEWVDFTDKDNIYTVVLEEEKFNLPQVDKTNKQNNQYIDPVTGMQFVTIDPGCFHMGSYNGENDEKPVHRVCLTKEYDIGIYEVTQAQWSKIMEYNPSLFQSDQRPVEQVSWNEVQTFIEQLNALSDQHYRLPTEAEWEYAARSGHHTKYPWGKKINCNQANYDGGKGTNCYYKPVDGYRGTTLGGTYQPNDFGLYDTVGNVWEWVQDRYGNDYYAKSPTNDPQGPLKGSARVNRGGSWGSSAKNSRTAVRFFVSPDGKSSLLGFRLVRTH